MAHPKQMLSVEELESQTAVELPERNVLNYSLVFIDVDTGDINVLSYDNFDTCVNSAVGILAAGNEVLQWCQAN